MKKKDFRTPLIYFLTVVIAVLLIVIKKQDDRLKEEIRGDEIGEFEEKKDKKSRRLLPIPPPPELKGTIGLVIDDFGYRDDEVSDGFLNLNSRLTYAIIPGQKYSTAFGQKAVSAGYEVMVHMPMENIGERFGEEDFVLLTSMTDKEIQGRMSAALNQIPTAIGVNNHQGSKASADQRIMKNVARILKERNLFFIDSRTTTETVAESTMEEYGVPTARRKIFLDNEDEEEKITEQLMELVQEAKESGTAIGIGHIRLKTLNVLKKHIPELQKKGYKFEFVSKMLH